MLDTTAQIHNIGVDTEIRHAITLSDGNLFIYLSYYTKHSHCHSCWL